MALDEIQIGGLGARRKRVEDARFIRGKGNYIDDFKLPGMLHMETLRSPIAHARITSIDTSRAWMTPGVHLVVTGEMAAQHNLAWMPTLSYDTQAVLATDKVRFQGQEICCVVADDPYIAKDACEVIVVEYDPLPPIVSPKMALAPGAPIIRDDKAGQTNNCEHYQRGKTHTEVRSQTSESSLWAAAKGTNFRRRFDGFSAQATDLYILVGVHVPKAKVKRAGIMQLRIEAVKSISRGYTKSHPAYLQHERHR